jgi:3-hydroxy acid dehydrogenase/malonic semialdehyde reductase
MIGLQRHLYAGQSLLMNKGIKGMEYTMTSLKNKIVLITGASAGIGAASAQAFAQEGAKLLLAARRREKLQAMQEPLLKAGAAAILTLELDVRDRRAVEQSVTSLPQEWKPIDVLINNAGLSRGLDKVQEANPDDWDVMIDTNIKGLLYVTRAVLPGMVERQSGHIINMGSTAGELAYPGGSVYCGTKAAERLITDGLHIDLLGTSIRVTSIDPGAVKTDFSLVRFGGDQARAAQVYEGITSLSPEDIARTMVWAASQPGHVNISRVLMTSTDQANSLVFHRRS